MSMLGLQTEENMKLDICFAALSLRRILHNRE
jgi:hypothetical protein